MKNNIIILDTINHDIGLKILFPQAKYYIMKEELNRTYYYNKYNFTPLFFQDFLNGWSGEDEIPYFFIIFPLYDCFKYYNGFKSDFYKEEFFNLFCIIVDFINNYENKIKQICIFDNYDYDYDPNIIFSIFPHLSQNILNKICFFKRNYNSRIKYLNNVYPFPFIIFGHKIIIDMLNNTSTNTLTYSSENRLFFAGNIYKHIDNVYGVNIDRENIIYKIKYILGNYLCFYNSLEYNQYYSELKKSKFCLDILGVGEPNIRTFEILASGSLLISQKNITGNLSWLLPDGIHFNSLTIFTDEIDLKNKLDILNNNDNLYNLCLEQQNFIVLHYMNTDFLRNYIVEKLLL